MSRAHRLEAVALDATWAIARAMSPGAARGLGAGLGDFARIAGVRRRVAEANLARALPERTARERATILAAHYRELGRVAMEYARLPALARSDPGQVVVAVHGLEHLEAARAGGRG